MWDAIVVGGRCAGAASARLLADGGRRVLLVERARFPADTMSTLFIHPPGVALLAEWGVLDAVVASGCPRLESMSYHALDVTLRAQMPSADGAATAVGAAFAPRRHILDRVLADAAVDAGAEFADGCSLAEVLWDGGRVAGVRLRTAAGTEVTERTRLLVGADGMRSRVAKLVDAPISVADRRMTCVYYAGWTGLPGGFAFRERPGRWIATIPTHDGVTLVAAYFPQEEFAALRTDPLAGYLDAVRSTAPDVFAAMNVGKPAVRIQGTGDQRNFFRKAHGPGWVLIGDAGHHRDTITAQGITNAFTQAQSLADELWPDPADHRRVDESLARFEARRDTLLTDSYRATLEVARLEVTPSRLESLRAIGRHPELTERYFAVVAGIIPMDEFLTPELADLL